MKSTKISCSDLLQLLPDKLLDRLGESTNVDYQVKKLTGRNMFNLMLMSILNSERLSLRVMEELYQSTPFKAFAGLDSGEKTSHTSLSDRLSNINYEYFEEIFLETGRIINKRFGSKELKHFNIERFDSTVVSLSAKLLNHGMANGQKNKQGEHAIKQLKFTIGFNGLVSRYARLYDKQEHLSEDLTLQESIESHIHGKDSIVVFDRGLKKRKAFSSFDKKGIQFVTRINPTNGYKLLKTLNTKKNTHDNLSFEEDLLVYLKDGNNTLVKTPLRLIKAVILNTKEPIFFISNIMDLNPKEIAHVYKLRWDIEVFFKFLKQELNFKHLLSRNENGIRVALYMTLITAMLLLLYKKLNNISGYKLAKIKFVNELDMEIMKIIIELCNGDPQKLKTITHFKGFGH